MVKQRSHAWLSVRGRQLFPPERQEDCGHSPASGRCAEGDRGSAWAAAEDEHIAVSGISVSVGMFSMGITFHFDAVAGIASLQSAVLEKVHSHFHPYVAGASSSSFLSAVNSSLALC